MLHRIPSKIRLSLSLEAIQGKITQRVLMHFMYTESVDTLGLIHALCSLFFFSLTLKMLDWCMCVSVCVNSDKSRVATEFSDCRDGYYKDNAQCVQCSNNCAANTNCDKVTGKCNGRYSFQN